MGKRMKKSTKVIIGISITSILAGIFLIYKSVHDINKIFINSSEIDFDAPSDRKDHNARV